MKTITIDNLNYKELGLACGLELHQQLNTNKLFCRCPSKIIKDNQKPNFIFKRKLKPVASESGELDVTALYEQNKDKTFTYYFYDLCNCLVETDSQPPFPINKDALKIAITMSNMTNSFLVHKSHIMRKQVIDGSNVSGFQRTALISTDGYLDFSFGRIRIDKILLEEDAARVIERKEEEVIYSLDRLGIPLIELVVWHDIHTPEDVKKVALNIGHLFRTTGKVRRGLGSIRQDINISIKDGSRVEIKGTQDLNLIPEIVKREVVRQVNLLQVREELKKRNINKFILEEKEVSNIFKNSDSKILRKGFEKQKKIFCFKLIKAKGILGFEIQPNRRVGTELASVIKATTSLKGIFHLDELPNYGITEDDINLVKNVSNIGQQDSFILILCNPKEIDYIKYILSLRLNQLIVGVPKETRLVNPEGNTEYQRPLSGGARMYPETDLYPIEYTKELLDEVEREAPLSLDERKSLYLDEFKLNKHLTDKMLFDNYAPIFEEIIKKYNIDPTVLIIFLLEDLKRAERLNLLKEEDVTKEKLINFFSSKHLKSINKKKLIDVFVYCLKHKVTPKIAIKKLNITSVEDNDLNVNEIVKEIILDNKDRVIELKERAHSLIMGRVMAETKGAVDGKKLFIIVSDKLKEFLNNTK